MEPDIPQLAEVTDSGWTDGYIMKKWLETVFDPYTRLECPAGSQLSPGQILPPEILGRNGDVVRGKTDASHLT